MTQTRTPTEAPSERAARAPESTEKAQKPRDGHPGALAARAIADGALPPDPGAAFTVQKLAGNRATGRMLSAATQRRVARGGIGGGGRALPHMGRLSRAFEGHDLGSIRLHDGPRASQAASAIGARAYAAGENIAVAGKPLSLHELAHEVTHIVQQRSGERPSGGVGRAGDRHERQADAVADRVVRGQRVASMLPTPRGRRAAPTAVQKIEAKDMGVVFAGAAMVGDKFNNMIRQWAQDLTENIAEDGQVVKAKVRHDLKDMDRALAKVEKKKRHKSYSDATAPTTLTDVIAASLIFPDLTAMSRGLARIRGYLTGEAGVHIVRMKNRIEQFDTRDFLLNIRMKSGYVAELQLHLDPTLDVKQGKAKLVAASDSKKFGLDPYDGGFSHYSGHDVYSFRRILDDMAEDVPVIADETMDDSVKGVLHRKRSDSMALGHFDMAADFAAALAEEREQADYGRLLSELRGLYREIQRVLMDEAWKTLVADDAGKQAYANLRHEQLDELETGGFDDHQDLKAIDTFFSTYGVDDTAKAHRVRGKYSTELKRYTKAAATSLRTAKARGDEFRTDQAERLAYHLDLLKAKIVQKKKKKGAGQWKMGTQMDQFVLLVTKLIPHLEEHDRLEAVRKAAKKKKKKKRPKVDVSSSSPDKGPDSGGPDSGGISGIGGSGKSVKWSI